MVSLGDYPGIVRPDAFAADVKGVSIEGEIYRVDRECLAELDRVECVSEGMYERRTVSLLTPSDLVASSKRLDDLWHTLVDRRFDCQSNRAMNSIDNRIYFGCADIFLPASSKRLDDLWHTLVDRKFDCQSNRTMNSITNRIYVTRPRFRRSRPRAPGIEGRALSTSS